MFKFKNPFEKWALVKTLKQNHTKYNYVYHIHLFESNKGKRKAEYRCNGDFYDIDRDDSWLRGTDLYQEKIYRWLSGRRDPDIPTYNEINQDDTVNYLKGKIQ